VGNWFKTKEDFKEHVDSFKMGGETLADLTKEDCLRRCPDMGDAIFNAVAKLKGGQGNQGGFSGGQGGDTSLLKEMHEMLKRLTVQTLSVSISRISGIFLPFKRHTLDSHKANEFVGQLEADVVDIYPYAWKSRSEAQQMDSILKWMRHALFGEILLDLV